MSELGHITKQGYKLTLEGCTLEALKAWRAQYQSFLNQINAEINKREKATTREELSVSSKPNAL